MKRRPTETETETEIAPEVQDWFSSVVGGRWPATGTGSRGNFLMPMRNKKYYLYRVVDGKMRRIPATLAECSRKARKEREMIDAMRRD